MTGFPKETLTFLEGIATNNEKAWFDAHRPLYETGYVEAAKAMVTELGPRLQKLSPGVQYDARINGSIARINRDIRFSKDKRPYKTHLDLWFWHGEKRAWDLPGFWFSFTPTAIHAGSGLYMFEGDRLDAFRQSVIHPRSGKALAAMVSDLTARGYKVEGKTRKRMPAGYEADPSRAEFLLYEGLFSIVELPVAAGLQTDFSDQLYEHLAATKPVNDWLIAEVVG